MGDWVEARAVENVLAGAVGGGDGFGLVTTLRIKGSAFAERRLTQDDVNISRLTRINASQNILVIYIYMNYLRVTYLHSAS